MISKSDIVEAIRVQRERLRKFQSFRRDLLLSLYGAQNETYIED